MPWASGLASDARMLGFLNLLLDVSIGRHIFLLILFGFQDISSL